VTAGRQGRQGEPQAEDGEIRRGTATGTENGGPAAGRLSKVPRPRTGMGHTVKQRTPSARAGAVS